MTGHQWRISDEPRRKWFPLFLSTKLTILLVFTIKALRAKTALYDIMSDNCNNKLVKEMLTRLHSPVNLLCATSLMELQRMPSSLSEIDQLASTLRERDAECAQTIASLHVKNACQVALQILRQSI